MKSTGFIQKWGLFLRWWLIFALIISGTVLLTVNGVTENVNQADFTKISFGIFALFMGFTIRNGVLTYKVCRDEDKAKEDDVIGFCQKTQFGWFIAKSLFTLGMIGTVLGFIFMLSTSFAGITVLNTAALQGALTKMSLGMSTALYTTAAGLICSLILQVQLFDISNKLDRLARICGCEVPDETDQS